MINIDNKNLKLWIIKLFSIVLSALILFGVIAYVIDPCLYYRINEKNKYVLNSRFVTSGIIKNKDYDTAIVGSSLIQNFNMQSFRDKMHCEPIKVTASAMNMADMEIFLSRLKLENKAKHLILNFDLTQFNLKNEKTFLPEYLYDDSKINDIKYLLGYETWARFIPFDAAIWAVSKVTDKNEDKINSATNIDEIERWDNDYVFSEDIVINNYVNGKYAVSKQILENMTQNMHTRLYMFLKNTKLEEFEDVVIILPPYSALFWYNAKIDGYYDNLMEFREYIFKTFLRYDNVRVVDLQGLPETIDLNHYKDLSHFDPYVQEKIIDFLVSKEYDVTKDNYNEKNRKIAELQVEFLKSYPQFKK